MEGKIPVSVCSIVELSQSAGEGAPLPSQYEVQGRSRLSMDQSQKAFEGQINYFIFHIAPCTYV